MQGILEYESNKRSGKYPTQKSQYAPAFGARSTWTLSYITFHCYDYFDSIRMDTLRVLCTSGPHHTVIVNYVRRYVY
ncbi:hypothetical protein KPH14_010439 [Odynerus spinipes]|uniref:Uncharacterized protein n=1 Tax=Odynerus spinipes TaxID=1348599 RepID=A0AAD9VTU2_9HYME|nr:hypothetical protein KPH14_010439 [Odynerus spinipes]